MKMVTIISILFTLIVFTSVTQSQELTFMSSTAWAAASDIELSGHYAYCLYENGLIVLDISNIASPIIVSQLPMPSDSYHMGRGKISIQGHFAYIISFYHRMFIIDISDPALPAITGIYDGGGIYSYGDLAVSGNYAYISVGASIYVVDISNPSNPEFVTQVSTSYAAGRVSIQGNYLYVAKGPFGGMVFDISNPENPTSVGSLHTDFGEIGISVSVSGNYAYLGEYGHKVDIFNISNPRNPQNVGEFLGQNAINDIGICDEYAYLCETNVLEVINVSDPSSPVLINTYNIDAYGIYFSGNTAYFSIPTTGLMFLNVTNPVIPDTLSIIRSGEVVNNVYLVNNRAYLACGKGGLFIYDISDPENPISLGRYDTPYSARAVAVQGDYAYIADYYTLQIANISNPADPTFASSINQYAYDVVVEGSYVYYSSNAGYNGLHIANIIDPTNPIFVGSREIQDDQGIDKVGNYILDAHMMGLNIIDVSDPSNPIWLHTFVTENPARDVCACGNYAYIAEQHETPGIALEIIDISDILNPSFVGSCSTSGDSYGIIVKDNYAYLADDGGGLNMIDVSDPTNPRVIDNYDSPYSAVGVAEFGGKIYVADYSSLLILNPNITGIKSDDINIPMNMSAYNYPNPFNTSTTINYYLTSASPVAIKIFDNLGRVVETLYNGNQKSGMHQVVWNAGDKATGSYFYCIDSGGSKTTEMMLLVK
jgi:hypothetical protein